MNNVRLAKLINALDSINDEYYYYDEEKEDTITELSEDDVYKMVMQDDELHLLGKETVDKWVHTFYNEWDEFERTKFIMIKHGVI